MSLGYSRQEADMVLKKLDLTMSLEDIIRRFEAVI